MDYLELEQERIERTQDLQILRRQHEQTAAALTQAEQSLANASAAFRSRLLEEQSELASRRHGLEQELAKLEQREQRKTLRAPVAGVVQQLAVNTVGGVVTPAQELMVIVPAGNSFEVEAFPFTKYGTLTGEVSAMSRDAVAHEQLGWAFSTRVVLDGNLLTADAKPMTIAPGMSVQVEVQTGERRLIEYLLTPILKGFKESARER